MPDLLAQFASATDGLAAEFSQGPWQQEITSAREEYDAARGAVYDDDPLFETHLALFLEWYTVERKLADGDPPVVRALGKKEIGRAPSQAEPSPDSHQVIRALAWSQRSLFQVLQRRCGGLLLADLVRDGVWQATVGQRMERVGEGEIFESRLLPWEGEVLLGPVQLFHPAEAQRSIHRVLREAEAQGPLTLKTVSLLAQMRLKYDRFRNIAVEKIYCSDYKAHRPTAGQTQGQGPKG